MTYDEFFWCLVVGAYYVSYIHPRIYSFAFFLMGNPTFNSPGYENAQFLASIIFLGGIVLMIKYQPMFIQFIRDTKGRLSTQKKQQRRRRRR